MTIPSFSVLDRKTKINRHTILEASAGTGKTFSIENIVTRLLVLDNSLLIDQILLVTFTNAATRDLKVRVRENIEKTLKHVRELSQGGSPSCPDYLQALAEEGGSLLSQAEERLSEALICYDRAQIFTIHGFCSKMLSENGFEAGHSMDASPTDKNLPLSEIRGVLSDFFKTGVRPEKYRARELDILLKYYGNDQEKLESALYQIINQDIPIDARDGYAIQFQRFVKIMSDLKTLHQIKTEFLLEDYRRLSPSFYVFKNMPKKTLDQAIVTFAEMFHKDIWTIEDFESLLSQGLLIVEFLDPSNLKKKNTLPPKDSLHYPNLVSIFNQELAPLVNMCKDPVEILACMAADAQGLFHQFVKEEEKFGPDNLLIKMREALENPKFLERVQKRYLAAIVDEFQDTDPIQWDIFKTLFFQTENQSCHLYLVGDPKQSIYAFRRADIYTYLDAVKTLGQEALFSLDTNYRSQPSLVASLNALFNEQNTPGLISLPKIHSSLPYRPVLHADKNKERVFSDHLGSIHFFTAGASQGRSKRWPPKEMENVYFFPFISNEIKRLHTKDGVKYEEMAILVKDRHQSRRLGEFLKQSNIPFVQQRTSSIADALSVQSLIEILESLLFIRDESLLGKALGGIIIGWTDCQLKELKDRSVKEKILMQMMHLRSLLIKDGFLPFFDLLMSSCWHPHNQNARDVLLSSEGGIEHYRDLLQLKELLANYQHEEKASLKQLIDYLKSLKERALDDDESFKRRSDPTIAGVKILTIHVSKGLEFEIVFALGLASRHVSSEEMVAVETLNGLKLTPKARAEESFKANLSERDAEKMRQLYVAMTRAKYRLYVPLAIDRDGGEIPFGEASPMELFLARLGQSPADVKELYTRAATFDFEAFTRFVNSLPSPSHITYSTMDDFLAQKVSCEEGIKDERIVLCPPKTVPIPGVNSYVHSFTSLTGYLADGAPLDKQAPPHDFHCVNKTAHSLPAGSETGLLFHAIFEHLDFSVVNACQEGKDLKPYLLPWIEKTSFEAWFDVIAEVVYQTLKCPLVNSNHSFCMADVDLSCSYRECEFLYSSDLKDFSLPGDLSLSSGMLKGVIDMCFEHQGRYYLIDWKSNWLGPDTSYYGQEGLKQAMEINHYDLQALIYREAFRRFVKITTQKSFEECFGGVIYLFLRGIDGTGSGVYYG